MLLTASTGCALTVLDTNVVAIVLPTIAREFHASFSDIEWVISTYVLCFASLLLPAGAIADRFGRRRVYLIGITMFSVASLLCGLAPSASGLYMARALQGISAAFLLAPALAIIGHSFHDPEARNRAWAIWGSIMGLTMVIAPILGGLIAYTLGWRWAFYINVPICTFLAGAVVGLVTESNDNAASRLDPFGIIVFAVFMFGLTWGMINGQAVGWGSPKALAGFIGGGVALVVFIVGERAQSRPMLDLSLFTNPRFLGAVWAMFAYAASAQVMASMLPLFLQNGLGRSALQAGFSMCPFAVAMLVFPHIGRLLERRMSSAGILTSGLALVAIGNGITAWGAAILTWPVILVGMVVLGSGGGLLNGETQKAIMSVVPRERSGMASGISTTSRFSGILLGFAMLSGILATKVRAWVNVSACGPACQHSSTFADAIVAGDLPSAVAGLEGPSRAIAVDYARQAFSHGFSAALLTAAGLALLSSLVVYVLMQRAD
ncbi:MFS transporter [Acetobacter orleanensis]|uniref:MFS transporter n=1 Tax=Acetobacter orleanensis TaxID=104099 RepID=A0A4Y3TMU7_9PROT|nr:major facilitator superfamily multidrug resistance transporter EmrB/QacA [Acetobacter orleanensis JCM 7639]GEB83128.1 MFS transporter [Acetobacter orleanensis]